MWKEKPSIKITVLEFSALSIERASQERETPNNG
jgi:hypothetical protein